MVSNELRAAFRHSLAHSGYVVGRRAIGAIEDARAELKLRRLIEEGIARIEVQEDPTPWDGDVPYTGPLFILTVRIDEEEDTLGGIATGEDDVATYYDSEGLQAVAPWGMQGGQVTIRGYLRACAVEMAAGMESINSSPARVRHIDATRRLFSAFVALEDAWDDSTHDEPANESYPFPESLDEMRARVGAYLENLED